MFRTCPVLLALLLISASARGQYPGTNPPESQPAQAGALQPGSAGAPRGGGSGSIPASSLPKTPPEEIERRRRIIEQMDRDDAEKERAALRDSADGKRLCAMLDAQIRDAESGVVRGERGDRTLSPEEKVRLLPVLHAQYQNSCR